MQGSQISVADLASMSPIRGDVKNKSFLIQDAFSAPREIPSYRSDKPRCISSQGMIEEPSFGPSTAGSQHSFENW
jgi:hypothetical protein